LGPEIPASHSTLIAMGSELSLLLLIEVRFHPARLTGLAMATFSRLIFIESLPTFHVASWPLGDVSGLQSLHDLLPTYALRESANPKDQV